MIDGVLGGVLHMLKPITRENRSPMSFTPPNHLVTQMTQSITFSSCLMRRIIILAPLHRHHLVS